MNTTSAVTLEQMVAMMEMLCNGVLYGEQLPIGQAIIAHLRSPVSGETFVTAEEREALARSAGFVEKLSRWGGREYENVAQMESDAAILRKLAERK